MTDYGIWTDSDGGFIAEGMTRAGAEKLLAELVSEDPENAEDLSVRPVEEDVESDE